MMDQDYDVMVREAFVQSAISEIDLNGKITYVNQRFSAVSKYPEKDLLGEEHDAFRFFEAPAQLLAIIKQHINAGKIFTGVLKNRSNDGHCFWSDVTIVPVRNKGGEIIKYVDARYPIISNLVGEYLYKKQAEKLGLSVA
jgi:PAS domain S-box-containing protein